MPSDTYAIMKYLLALDQLGWTNATAKFRAMLVKPSYVFNFVHQHVSDVISHEVSGGTYGRVDVIGRTAALDIPGNRAICDASNPLFVQLGGLSSSPAGMIVYKQIGGNDTTPGDDPLVCFLGFPAPTPANGLNYLVEFDPLGAFVITRC